MVNALAVFLNNDGQFKLVAENVISLFAEINAVKESKIYVETTDLRENDPQCCPSLKARKIYSLLGNKIIKSK